MRTPVLFVLGLSGAGKTELSNWIAGDLGFFHFDIDRPDGRDGIDVANFRSEWNGFLGRLDAEPLAAAIRRRTADEGAAGFIGHMGHIGQGIRDPDLAPIAARVTL